MFYQDSVDTLSLYLQVHDLVSITIPANVGVLANIHSKSEIKYGEKTIWMATFSISLRFRDELYIAEWTKPYNKYLPLYVRKLILDHKNPVQMGLLD